MRSIDRRVVLHEQIIAVNWKKSLVQGLQVRLRSIAVLLAFFLLFYYDKLRLFVCSASASNSSLYYHYALFSLWVLRDLVVVPFLIRVTK